MSKERFHPSEYLADELQARGWTTRDCAQRMGGDPAVDELALDLLMTCDPRLRIDEKTATGLARAFGTSAETWRKLKAAYHGENL